MTTAMHVVELPSFDRARHRIGSGPRTWLWCTPALVLIACTIIVPVIGFTLRVGNPSSAISTLTRPQVVDAIRFSAWQALWSTLFTSAIGMVMAWILGRYEFRGRRFVHAAMTVPFVLPTVVVGASFLALLPQSMERSLGSIVMAHAFFNISVIIRLVVPVLSIIHPDQFAVARTLGASQFGALRRIGIPMVAPALKTAVSIVFLMSFTSYGVVRVLGGSGLSTVEVEIYRRAVVLGDLSGSAVLALAQTIVIVAVVGLASRRPPQEFVRIRVQRQPIPRWAGVTTAGVTLAVMTPLTAMTLSSVMSSGHWTSIGWQQLVASDSSLFPGIRIGEVVIRSLAFAVIAATIAVPIGVAAAVGLGRRQSSWIESLLVVPMAVSAVVVGFGILVTYDTDPIDVRSSWWLLPVIHAVVALPLVVRSALGVVRSIPQGLRDAAAVLGASPFQRWWKIDMALLRPALATGLGLSMALSLGEFGATSFLTRRGSLTLPIVIDQLLGRTGDTAFTTAMATSTILMILTAVVVVAFDASSRT